jgi:hypothetical protein
MDSMFLSIVAGLLLLGVLVFLTVCCVLLEKKNKETKARVALEADSPVAEESFDAAVVDLQCRVVTLGERSVKTVSEYLVFFKRTDGTVCRYPVSEEFYSGFEIGQRGSVSVIDGAVYAFRLEDENIVE